MSYICNVDDIAHAISVYKLDVDNKIELLDRVHEFIDRNILEGACVTASTTDGRQIVVRCHDSSVDFSCFELLVLEHGFDHILAIQGCYKDIDICFSFQRHNLTDSFVMAVIIAKENAYILDDLLTDFAVL